MDFVPEESDRLYQLVALARAAEESAYRRMVEVIPELANGHVDFAGLTAKQRRAASAHRAAYAHRRSLEAQLYDMPAEGRWP